MIGAITSVQSLTTPLAYVETRPVAKEKAQAIPKS